MRKLKTVDIPAFCRCVKKLGLKDQIRTIALQSDTMQDAWGQGFDLLWNLFDIATEREGEAVIYEFLAGPFEMKPAEVADLDLADLMDNLQQLAADNNLTAFFKLAAASTK